MFVIVLLGTAVYLFPMLSEEETITIRIDNVEKKPIMRYYVTLVEFYDLDNDIFCCWEFHDRDYSDFKGLEGKNAILTYQEFWGPYLVSIKEK